MITHLNEKLIAVEVPSDIKKMLRIKLDFNGNYMLESTCNKFKLKIPFDFKIIGEVDAENISFDVEAYVEISDNPYWFSRGMAFIDYTNDSNCFRTENDSFISLLHSKGIDTNKPNVKHVILEKV